MAVEKQQHGECVDPATPRQDDCSHDGRADRVAVVHFAGCLGFPVDRRGCPPAGEPARGGHAPVLQPPVQRAARPDHHAPGPLRPQHLARGARRLLRPDLAGQDRSLVQRAGVAPQGHVRLHQGAQEAGAVGQPETQLRPGRGLPQERQPLLSGPELLQLHGRVAVSVRPDGEPHERQPPGEPRVRGAQGRHGAGLPRDLVLRLPGHQGRQTAGQAHLSTHRPVLESRAHGLWRGEQRLVRRYFPRRRRDSTWTDDFPAGPKHGFRGGILRRSDLDRRVGGHRRAVGGHHHPAVPRAETVVCTRGLLSMPLRHLRAEHLQRGDQATQGVAGAGRAARGPQEACQRPSRELEPMGSGRRRHVMCYRHQPALVLAIAGS